MTVRRLLSRLWCVLSVLLLTGVMWSCHTSRVAVKAPDLYSIQGTPQERVNALAAYYDAHPLEAYSVPVTLELTSPAEAKISGTLTVMPSRYIHFSARFLGMEVGSIMITPDSIFGKIKPGKKYLAEPLTALTGAIPLTLDRIQDILAGRIIIPWCKKFDPDAKSFPGYSQYEDEWYISPLNVARNLDLTFSMSSESNNLRLIQAFVPDKCFALISLDRYGPSPVAGMPSFLYFNLVSSTSHVYEADMTLNLSRLKSGIDTDRSWATPRGYTRVSAADLIKILANL